MDDRINNKTATNRFFMVFSLMDFDFNCEFPVPSMGSFLFSAQCQFFEMISQLSLRKLPRVLSGSP